MMIRTGALNDAPDVFQTEEWFGSAGGAYPMIMSTERFAELVEGSMGAYVKNA